ncbi:VacJ family lipoprotein [Deltaproteobacteria bacterium TL4]
MPKYAELEVEENLEPEPVSPQKLWYFSDEDAASLSVPKQIIFKIDFERALGFAGRPFQTDPLYADASGNLETGSANKAVAVANDPLEAPDKASESSDEGFNDFSAGSFDDEFATPPEAEKVDPLSGYNRFMTQVNDKIYVWVLDPVSRGYGYVVPEGVRQSIVRFFKNLLFPVRFVNNTLQLKMKNAGEEFLRFSLNTTVGLLGFFDPAKAWFDLEEHPEDFGQTLGHYGVGSGFHIVLPILGPSNLRDTVGMLPDDYYINPVSCSEPYKEQGICVGGMIAQLGVRAFDIVNETSLHLGEYENLKSDAVDLYPFLRDVYEQNRQKEIEE